MRPSYLPKWILGVGIWLSITSSFAGSDRWIMVMTDQRMVQEVIELVVADTP